MTTHGAPEQSTDAFGRQVVHSPEQVALHLPVAGPTNRILAYAIDLIMIAMLTIVAFFVLSALTPLAETVGDLFDRVVDEASSDDPDALTRSTAVPLLIAIFLVLQLAIEWGYFVVWEVLSGGRSLGKIALGLRVVRDGGLGIGLRDSLVRNLLRTVDILPMNYLVGLVAMVLSPEGKRLGDLAGGTIVIRLDRPQAAAQVEENAPAGLERFRFDREQILRVGAAERRLVRQTLRRIETLPRQRAEEALQRTANAICSRLGHEPVPLEEARAFLYAVLDASQRSGPRA